MRARGIIQVLYRHRGEENSWREKRFLLSDEKKAKKYFESMKGKVDSDRSPVIEVIYTEIYAED